MKPVKCDSCNRKFKIKPSNKDTWEFRQGCSILVRGDVVEIFDEVKFDSINWMYNWIHRPYWVKDGKMCDDCFLYILDKKWLSANLRLADTDGKTSRRGVDRRRLRFI